jgi:chemotaxis protein MotB
MNRTIQNGEIIMQACKTTILVASLVALAGCGSMEKSATNADSSPICEKTHGWTAWNDVRCNADNTSKDMAAGLQAKAGDEDALAADLAASKRRNLELERQLGERDAELAALHGELSAEMTKLKAAQRRLIPALRPQIEKGDITVDLNNERLLINLASGYLFGSGQDVLKPAGAEALKHVGAVLKDFPEYKVAVDGHTDNVPIGGALTKKFPTNKELSESRATHAAKALIEGGLGTATTHGYADTKPVEPNTTDVGRAKNRRVEVRVTR